MTCLWESRVVGKPQAFLMSQTLFMVHTPWDGVTGYHLCKHLGINIAYINKQWKLLVNKIRQPNVYTTQYNSQWWMIWCGIIWASLVHWVFDDITAELLCSQCATVSNCGVFIVVVRFVWQSQQGTNKISICNKTSVTVLFAIQCENLLLYNRPLSSEAYLKLF